MASEVGKGASSAPTDLASKLAAVTAVKAEGNDAFKQGEVRAALKSYKKALLHMASLRSASNGEAGLADALGKGPTKLTDAETQQVRSLASTVLLNIVACYLKLQDGAKALKYAQQAATEGAAPPDKTALRLGQAYLLKGDLYNAEEVLKKAAEEHTAGPVAVAIRKALATARSRSKNARAAFGAKLSAAFASAASGGT